MNKKLVLDFIKAINEHDIDKICMLMSDDHKFIDANGNEVIGKDKMRTGWEGYFSWFPDYKIEVTDIFEKRERPKFEPAKKGYFLKMDFVRYDFIVVFGFASGTFGEKPANNGNHFHLPSAWKAIIEGGKIKLWQVYCDTKIPYDIIEKNQKLL